MRRVIIFGNSSSGKTTLAKKISKEQNLAHLDLDTLAWRNTKPPSRMPLPESKKLIEAFLKTNSNWVIEGCYADLLQLVTTRANYAIFMNLPVEQCQINAQNRPWEPHKYPSKAAQDASLAMLLGWIADYETRTDEFSYQAHIELYNAFTENKKQITSNHENNN